MESTPFSPGRYASFPGRYADRSRGVRRSFPGGTPFSSGPRCWLFHRGYAVFRGTGTRGTGSLRDHRHPICFHGGYAVRKRLRTVYPPWARPVHGRSPFSAAAGRFRASWKPVVRRRFHRGYAIRGDTRSLCLAAFMRGSPSPDAPRIDSWTGSLPGLTNSIPSSSAGAAQGHYKGQDPSDPTRSRFWLRSVPRGS
jgi:hypothetical protein